MVNLRLVENYLALERKLSATSRLTLSFQLLVGKCVELHHQYAYASAPDLGPGAFLHFG